MKLSFISDLHLAPGALNRCTSEPDALLALMDRLQAHEATLIVAGDCFDLLRPARLRAWRAQLDRIKADQPALFARLMACPMIFGNHDEALKVLHVPEERYYHGHGVSVMIVHGHQNDPLFKRLPGVAEVANFGAGWMVRAGASGAAEALGQVPSMLDRLRGQALERARIVAQDPMADRCAQYAQRLIDQEGVEVVVMGHSHQLRLVPLRGGLLINTGSHTDHTLDWASLDLAAGIAQLGQGDQITEIALRRSPGQWQLEPCDERV